MAPQSAAEIAASIANSNKDLSDARAKPHDSARPAASFTEMFEKFRAESERAEKGKKKKSVHIAAHIHPRKPVANSTPASPLPLPNNSSVPAPSPSPARSAAHGSSRAHETEAEVEARMWKAMEENRAAQWAADKKEREAEKALHARIQRAVTENRAAQRAADKKERAAGRARSKSSAADLAKKAGGKLKKVFSMAGESKK